MLRRQVSTKWDRARAFFEQLLSALFHRKHGCSRRVCWPFGRGKVHRQCRTQQEFIRKPPRARPTAKGARETGDSSVSRVKHDS